MFWIGLAAGVSVTVLVCVAASFMFGHDGRDEWDGVSDLR